MSSQRVYPHLAFVHRRARVGIGALLLLVCAACTPPPDSPTEKPAEPQATQLRDAMQKPLDSARSTQATVDADAQRQRQAIEDAGG
ncbi:hypothetical protein LU699_12240 [Luteimonas fraxinea]|uniref:Uncharacterized protein n=1 Tax=Luteimonas fraxinea TaxID=2901869 RepID=A0ABS8UJ62_9GAMM|nr:hypothetical protein [Luteimonas fraxinea]MCD9098882.1 hypothetical protein [Luteimonas fraxinea]MCD9125254.1 hypothetical protein [Luteimonas fraxinea]UHH09062.1 hypothetical protein LU699_12240 [Luteimonas fraxinea]